MPEYQPFAWTFPRLLADHEIDPGPPPQLPAIRERAVAADPVAAVPAPFFDPETLQNAGYDPETLSRVLAQIAALTSGPIRPGMTLGAAGRVIDTNGTEIGAPAPTGDRKPSALLDRLRARATGQG